MGGGADTIMFKQCAMPWWCIQTQHASTMLIGGKVEVWCVLLRDLYEQRSHLSIGPLDIEVSI